MADRYEGFETFVAQRGPALMRTASLLTGDRGLAEDALQETLTKVALKWPSVRAEGDPEPYVRRALYSVVVDRWRWRSRRAPEQLGDVPDAHGSPDHAADADRRLTVAAALGRLTPRQRQVLVLRYYEDLTEAQTAAVMHCSVSTVKSQARHALQRLRTLAPDLVEAFSPEVPA
jgi:RNA polymerase sigma-70 factor (sigma-E family)